ncbi:DNA-binding NarL/FixJ family response regulator [Kribbella orskensis]|uniref:DNA-binding NarL/FixJ family response regulator n=1 Tax=Kribbella orskensis TaxID=2512216 RepID=A0ABY2BMJ9_9ACTN|nr:MULTISPECIES: response regulator transcription factor [Kribbella]TCN41782.1 DNA-binding NarL/FixJ family response regulator [Kribbella sp. VKM Ac-2500]TCO25660.1 DNA-binding NarL/FixJ family response regulator [Kribbella orskensis]
MIRILVVDDHGLIRSSLRSRLDREPDLTTVGEAGTVPQAIQRARALQPDVILLDLVLPRRSGTDAIPDLLKEAPSTRILVVSSLAQPTSVRRALAAGAHGYVPKRASDTQLIEAIHRIAAGERYVDPDLGAQLVVADGVPALEPISDRERDVLDLLALGYTNQEIGRKLYISVRTVDTHRAHIMRKLDLATRAELVLFALANGLIGAS